MNDITSDMGTRAGALKNKKWVQVGEIFAVFLTASAIILIAKPFVGENPVVHQSVVWVSNIVMLGIIWFGLRMRGESWSHLGLSWSQFNGRSVLISLLVFLGALAGFLIGSVVMANITGIPENADMSGYNYLEGNLPMLILALIAIFIASSFGEEVIYRGFLITRIGEMGGNSKGWVRTAVVISSIVFGLIHFEWGAMGMVQTGFMGLALGIAYLLTKRNLWSLVFAHAYLDAILMVQMYLGS